MAPRTTPSNAVIPRAGEGPLDHTADLNALAQLVASQSTQRVLGRALVALEGLVPYDLAAIFRLHDDGHARMVASAGPLARSLHEQDLDLQRFPVLQRALELRRPVALDADHHAHEGDPYDGVLDLPHGHSCMVVPLFAGERTLGLITLDRATCGPYSDDTVERAGMVGQLVSLALVLAEQTQELERTRRQLQAENQLLVAQVGGDDVAVERMASLPSPVMRELVLLARQVATAELPVVIRGETGTGKEVLARALHAWGRRRDKPFVALNCAAIPENLVESELFGHVKGAFSGADRARPGRFATADGGTLFLDEIGEMPLAAQAKLLRVLEEGTYEPVGSDRTQRVSVRVLAATHVDLEEAVRHKTFREDLYYRLAVFELRLPPLRERPDDAVAIARSLLAARARRGQRWVLSKEADLELRRAPWPGNVRQLVNALERAMIVSPDGVIGAGALGLTARPAPSPNADLPDFQENEARYLRAVLERAGGRLAGPGGAAEITGLKPTTLRSRLLKLGLR